MSTCEIERKFLVKDPESAKNSAFSQDSIVQSYLGSDPSKVIRIRIINDVNAYLTVKGKSSDDGLVRTELETKIDHKIAAKMIEMFGEGTINKIRYIVCHEGKIWELDEFFGSLHGLWLAECETSTVEEAKNLILPNWIGADVTNDHRFSNLSLGIYGLEGIKHFASCIEVPDQEGYWVSPSGNEIEVYRLDPVGGTLCVWGPDIGYSYTGNKETQSVWDTDEWQGHIPVSCIYIRNLGPWRFTEGGY
jgi:CYTH domain-containing protein